jgi:hypothetical protein
MITSRCAKILSKIASNIPEERLDPTTKLLEHGGGQLP